MKISRLMLTLLTTVLSVVKSEQLINIGVQTFVLNHSHCSLQPGATSFVAHYIGMREVKRDAFGHCFNLLTIDLMMNELTYIDKDTFTGQRKLETLNLIGNRIQQLHKDVFIDLINLKQLLLGYNRLKSFSPALLRNLHNLEILRVQANNFTNLNSESVSERTPKLRRINFNNGRYNCDTLAEMVKYFEERGIQVEHYHADVLPKDAIIKDERICIPDMDDISETSVAVSTDNVGVNVTLLYNELATLNTRLIQQETEINALKAELKIQSNRVLDTLAKWSEQMLKLMKEQSVVQGHVLESVQNITTVPKLANLSVSERKCLKTRYSNLYK